MNVELSNTAEKQLRRLNEPLKGRIADAIDELGNKENIEKLHGRDGYRVRIGSYRIIFDIDKKNNKIDILKIATRGDVYKEN
jgi:mRNA interferase RelE/StbE